MQTRENHQLCNNHMNRFVKITMSDGKSYVGYIVNLENNHVILAAPQDNEPAPSNARDSRFFPFFWVGLPLAFIAGVAASRRPYAYPCPVYPCPAYPYQPVYPYNYGYGYGY